MTKPLLAAFLVADLLFGEGSEVARITTAKALWADRKYSEARAAFQAVEKTGAPVEREEALYFIARCSESLGELERAFSDYGAFLDQHPSRMEFRDEAVTARIGIATKLYKSQHKEHLSTITDALGSQTKAIRYFAALQLSSLPQDVGRGAVPVLREILAQEKDEDLVGRAKVAMLRVDPTGLAREEPPPKRDQAQGTKKVSWLRVRVAKGAKTEVEVHMPVGLAELIFKSLPDDAKKELQKKGYDADNFWTRLKSMGPTSIVHIQGDDGETIDITLE